MHLLEPVDDGPGPRLRRVRRSGHERPVGAAAGGSPAPSRSAAGRTLVNAEVPQLEITRYAVDLRSLSHGTGTFSRAYSRHEAMPTHLLSKVVGEEEH